jgi:peptidoglycan hydrolase CwlO-like protein
MNKKILIAVSVLFILMVVILSVRVSKSAKQKPAPMEDRLPAESAERIKYPLQPADPKDYGMVVLDQGDAPLTEGQARTLIQEKLKEIKSQFPEEKLKKMRETIKEDPQKTADKLKKIDEEIEKCRQVLQGDPYSEEANAKLQRLIMLKSIGEELPKE